MGNVCTAKICENCWNQEYHDPDVFFQVKILGEPYMIDKLHARFKNYSDYSEIYNEESQLTELMLIYECTSKKDCYTFISIVRSVVEIIEYTDKKNYKVDCEIVKYTVYKPFAKDRKSLYRSLS
jgi:hypothetical protein